MKHTYKILASCLTLAVVTSQAKAAVVTAIQFNSGNVLPSSIVAVSTDLLQTSLSGVTGDQTNQNLRNGTTGTAYDNSVGDPANINVSNGYTTTYDLDVTVNVYGYDITEFRLFSGWNDLRASQQYTISYSLVGSSAFTTLTSFTSLQNDGSLLTRTYDDTAAPLISGVDAVRFNFVYPDNDFGRATVYREIDVLGTATIPEPSAAILGGLGLLALLRRRR
jgi:uncharacterized protein (TIGR03382 family)